MAAHMSAPDADILLVSSVKTCYRHPQGVDIGGMIREINVQAIYRGQGVR